MSDKTILFLQFFAVLCNVPGMLCHRSESFFGGGLCMGIFICTAMGIFNAKKEKKRIQDHLKYIAEAQEWIEIIEKRKEKKENTSQN